MSPNASAADWNVRYLNFSDAETARQAEMQAEMLQTVAPVLLPEPGSAGGRLLREGADRHVRKEH